MPFIDSAGGLLRTVELGQVPLYAPTFQLRERIGYYEAGTSPEVVTWAEAHIPDLTPEPGNRTDLASVPVIFWSLIASYGRQTAPAIVHDSECWRIRQLDVPAVDALAERERADRLFRLGLRELGVAPFRAWLMWTFVSFERYQKHSLARFIGMLALGILGVALVVAGATLALTGTPAAAALVARAPADERGRWSALGVAGVGELRGSADASGDRAAACGVPAIFRNREPRLGDRRPAEAQGLARGRTDRREEHPEARQLARCGRRRYLFRGDDRAHVDAFEPTLAVNDESCLVSADEHPERIRRLPGWQSVPHDDPHARGRDGYHELGE